MIYKLKRLSHIKDFKSRKLWITAVWDDLMLYIHELQPKQIDLLLKHVLTPTERERIARRAVAVDRFSTGTHYRSVAEETMLSTQALYAIKKALKKDEYVSDWDIVRIRKAQRKKDAQYIKERPLPIRYRRTKYGKTRTW
jgi:hypothetical protein